jgi:hypothetical protein
LKFRVECKSLLLQKALEEFLKDYLDENGIVISDEKGDIIIGKDIKKPFSKSQLLLQLKKISQSKQNFNLEEKPEVDKYIKFNDLIKNESFEDKLDNLIKEFSIKLKKLIKEEYDKK